MARRASFLVACLALLPAAGLRAADAAAPRWFANGRPSPQAAQLLAQLAGAGNHGLRAEYYDAAALAQRVAGVAGGGTDSTQLAALDRDLSQAAMRFGSDLQRGHVDPRSVGLALNRPPADDGASLVARLAASRDLGADFDALEPDFLHYRLLQQWLVRYRALAQQAAALPPLAPLPARTRSIKPGDHYAGSDALRALLALLGDLPASEAVPRGDVLDTALAAALARFQQRHGLAADGALGRRTFDALSTPLSRRVRQIELTLERWRWLPEFKAPPIIINIPQFRLFAFRSLRDRAADILQMDVIVGQSYRERQTPIFIAELQQVVFQPYWDVPSSILRKELLAPIRRDPGYLQRNDMELVRGPSDESPVVAPTPENIELLAAGKLRLRQRPGAKNALGPIKFVFPNDFGVYLHGTPAQRLFQEARRDFSHGCIRLADPPALAVHVLRGTAGDWTDERVRAAMEADRVSYRVRVAQPLPVMVMYGTALATEDGRILFFEDIYGHDRRLERLLP